MKPSLQGRAADLTYIVQKRRALSDPSSVSGGCRCAMPMQGHCARTEGTISRVGMCQRRGFADRMPMREAFTVSGDDVPAWAWHTSPAFPNRARRMEIPTTRVIRSRSRERFCLETAAKTRPASDRSARVRSAKCGLGSFGRTRLGFVRRRAARVRLGEAGSGSFGELRLGFAWQNPARVRSAKLKSGSFGKTDERPCGK